MKSVQLCLAIALGIFLGLSGWSLTFQQPPRPAAAGSAVAGIGACGDVRYNPCYVSIAD